MKLFKSGFFFVAFLAAFAHVCLAAEADAPPPAALETPNANDDLANRQPAIEDVIKMPVQNELGQEARETLAYLLFVQAIFDEDEAALLEAASMLAQCDAPSDVWLDGGLWLMSRKSPNSVIYLEHARKAMPEDLSILLLYADSLGDHNMAGRGVQEMRAYLQKHPNTLDAKIELALLLVKDHKFDEAQKILNGISPKQRTPLVDYYQAQALMGMQRRTDAIPYLRKAIKGMPDFPEAMAELAFIFEQQGNLREARGLYEKLQKLQFSPQEVGLRLINLSLKLRQPEKASQYVRRGPDNMAFKISAANMFMEARHFLQAENLLKQVAEQPNAPVEVYLLLADIVYEQRKNLKMALDWLKKIPPGAAGSQKAVILEAQLLAEAGKPGEALKYMDQKIAENPEAPEYADMRVRLLARLKKSAEALETARQAHQKWPANVELAFLYGSLLDEAGDKQEAMRVMENIVKDHPDNFQALNYVGYTLAEENRDIARALELLEKANELAPNQAYIMDSLAWAHFRANQLEDALKLIRAATALPAANDASIWEHYGDIAAKSGVKTEARKAYRKALELKPENAGAVRAKLSGL